MSDPRTRRAAQIREAVLDELRSQSGDHAIPGLTNVRVSARHLHALVSRSSIGPVSLGQVRRALAALGKDGLADGQDGWKAVDR
jgi:hypothetical protein